MIIYEYIKIKKEGGVIMLSHPLSSIFCPITEDCLKKYKGECTGELILKRQKRKRKEEVIVNGANGAEEDWCRDLIPNFYKARIEEFIKLRSPDFTLPIVIKWGE